MSLLLIGMVSIMASAQKKVSVFVEGNLTKLQEQIVNNAFMSKLSSSHLYSTYERSDNFINAINREHDYQVSGEVPKEQIRRIGEKYGVDFVIAVCVMNDCETLYMSARLINVTTGRVDKTITLDRDGISNKTLKNLSNNVAYRLLGQN